MIFYIFHFHLTVCLVNRVLHFLYRNILLCYIHHSPMLRDLDTFKYFATIHNTAMNNLVHLHRANAFSYICRYIFMVNFWK